MINQNKYKILNIISILFIGYIFLGCSQKIKIKALKSSKITDNSIKFIGVNPFKNDNISQSSQISSAISNLKIDDKNYFTLVDRQNINKIMSEKKLNDSGLVDLDNSDNTIGLVQMKILLTGEVILNDLSSSSFYENRTDYKNCVDSYKKNGKIYCRKYRKYNVRCRSNIYTVKTKVKLTKIIDSTILFSKNYEVSATYQHCTDDNKILPSKLDINTKLAKNIANQVIVDIAPSYVYFDVVLLEDEDIDFDDQEELMFENSLKLIEHKRIKKANELLKILSKKVNNQSYVVLYNLCVTEEALGNIEIAYKLLRKAEDIALVKVGLVDEISVALKRVEKNIAEKNKVEKLVK